jgi:hypothetical protein
VTILTFALSGWMLYTMLIVLGLLWLDFLFAFFHSLMNGKFNLLIILEYLKDMLFYVFPLMMIVNMIPLDPFEWILKIIYLIASIGVMAKYVVAISNKMK